MKHLTLNRQANSTIRRVRRLPFAGQVLVEPGQSVHPEDLIAVAELPAEIFSLDIARGLGIDPSEVLSCLVRDLDEELAQGDVLAECDGAFPRLMRVPQAGRLLACRDGMAFIAAGKRSINLQAGMIGVVTEIMPERGVVITTQGGLIQGVWGNGRVGAGVLRVQTSALDKSISSDDLKTIDEGQVIAAELCSEESELMSIAEMKPTGLILGSIASDLMGKLLAMPFPIILLQGFGDLVPDRQTFTMLQERSGDLVCINACQPNIMTGEQPEVMIPNNVGETAEMQPFRTELRVGMRVQALSGAENGGTFTVVELPEAEATLESGLTCKVAVLQLNAEETITVPRVNLIVLGGQDS